MEMGGIMSYDYDCENPTTSYHTEANICAIAPFRHFCQQTYTSSFRIHICHTWYNDLPNFVLLLHYDVYIEQIACSQNLQAYVYKFIA